MKDTATHSSERQLRRTVRDLVALSTLPALWSGFEAARIASSLGDALLKILELDFVVVTVRREDEPAISTIRSGGRSAAHEKALHDRIATWLDAQTPEPPPLRDPADDAPLRSALARFGHSGDHGLVVAISRREGFPSQVERLLLGVGANYTATVLQRKRDEESLRRRNHALETLTRFSRDLAAERDPQAIAQTVTDAGRELSGARFGAFFYNVIGAAGESYMLYSLSGAEREDFAGFPMPRNTHIFGPTFRGEPTVRIDDVQLDARYGLLPPYHGLPPGHLPVRSYLATPVISRSGEVIGGLFFGHPEPGVFRAESEGVVEALAAHAAIAIDNARLYRSLQLELSEREAAEGALRDAAERKDEFLAMLGHELRNPLAPVRNCLHILEHSDDDPGQRRRAREIMGRQVSHLTRLVDDLLDVARISRGKIELRKERLDILELVRQTVEDHRSAMTAAGLQLDLQLAAGSLWVEGDRVRLAQSLGNLLENAAKFADRGGRVSVRAAREGASVVVRVVDDGLGIPPEELPHIFEPFSQLGGTRERSPGGLGLGLAVVKRLVELHGGTIQAFSEGPGHGAELSIALPIVEDQQAPRAQAQPHSTGPAAHDHRILLIEDHPDSAETLSELLRLYGHRVEVAHDGNEGISKAREFHPDVVLCDIGLPGGLDGYGVAGELRRMPSADLFLVALTGYGQEADRRRALAAGFDAHLTKPADPAALQRLLAGRRAAAQ
jgi:signal transduction histidine kinase/ActR/RegA family two-component response regulator